ncbi:MAG: hypothetical protein V4689_18370 [Verrucomicrobiota bacterium]
MTVSDFIHPPGVSGEIWISGSGLADGYWQHPHLTDKTPCDRENHTS